jgi:hypothetical protein
VMALRNQDLRANAANIACCACNQDVHPRLLFRIVLKRMHRECLERLTVSEIIVSRGGIKHTSQRGIHSSSHLWNRDYAGVADFCW